MRVMPKVVMVIVILRLILMMIYLMTVSCNHLTSLSWSKAKEVFLLSRISPSSW